MRLLRCRTIYNTTASSLYSPVNLLSYLSFSLLIFFFFFFFFSSRRRHTRLVSDWSSDVCSSDLLPSDGCSFRGLGTGPNGRPAMDRRFPGSPGSPRHDDAGRE